MISNSFCTVTVKEEYYLICGNKTFANPKKSAQNNRSWELKSLISKMCC